MVVDSSDFLLHSLDKREQHLSFTPIHLHAHFWPHAFSGGRWRLFSFIEPVKGDSIFCWCSVSLTAKGEKNYFDYNKREIGQYYAPKYMKETGGKKDLPTMLSFIFHIRHKQTLYFLVSKEGRN